MRITITIHIINKTAAVITWARLIHINTNILRRGRTMTPTLNKKTIIIHKITSRRGTTIMIIRRY